MEQLRKINTGLLTAALVMAIALLATGLWHSWVPGADPYNDFNQVPDAPDRAATVWSNGAKRYTVYSYEHEDVPEAISSVRIIDMTSGRQLAVSDNPDQKIYGFAAIGHPEGAEDGSIAYVALLRNGGSDKRPLFDLAIGDLASMRQTVVARKVRYLDQPTGIGPRKISMIVEDGSGSSFRIFDLSASKFTVNERVDLAPRAARETEADRASGAAAPAAEEAGKI